MRATGTLQVEDGSQLIVDVRLNVHEGNSVVTGELKIVPPAKPEEVPPTAPKA